MWNETKVRMSVIKDRSGDQLKVEIGYNNIRINHNG